MSITFNIATNRLCVWEREPLKISPIFVPTAWLVHSRITIIIIIDRCITAACETRPNSSYPRSQKHSDAERDSEREAKLHC